MKIIMTLLTLACTVSPVVCHGAGAPTVTFYRDGAVLEIEMAAIRGTAEITLPPDAREATLRIEPLEGSVIERVKSVTPRRKQKDMQELERLQERKERLEDRLKALESRERIFSAAARSQSGKAPRRTKGNPDPLQAIRQGTDFAIAQLEAVYTSRRKTEQEMRRIAALSAALEKSARMRGRDIQVRVSPKNGRIRVRVALDSPGWTPRYDIRLGRGENAAVSLFAQASATCPGCLTRISPASLSQEPPQRNAGVTLHDQEVRLAELRLPVTEAAFSTRLDRSPTFVLHNGSDRYLPPGEAALYRNGEYWGTFRFEGMSSGRMRRICSAPLP
jgi:chaperonin cofactor prefoldin